MAPLFAISRRLPRLDAPALTRASIHRQFAAAGLLSAAVVLGLGGWASLTDIDGAVIAPGQLVVESDVKKVQHPTGGVVAELLVRDGDRVRAGDALVRLDETQTRAVLDTTLKTMDEMEARRARGEAELNDARTITFPSNLLGRETRDERIATLLEGERRLFAARMASREGKQAQLGEHVAQLREEIAGLSIQAQAKAHEMTLIQRELGGLRALYDKGLVPLSRVTALDRDAARLEGERGQYLASIASVRGKIAETSLQVLQVVVDMRADAGKELAEIRGKWSELVEKRVSAEDQMKRVVLRAPQDGVIHEMSLHTVGGLVSATEPAMLVVPEADALVIEVRIRPQDIDSVRRNQPARVRLQAFDQRTTPELDGIVTRVSADVSQDRSNGQNYFTARITIAGDQGRRLAGLRLVPGMPVEAYLLIGARSALSYLVRPLSDQVRRAWRER
jgi:HlyD family secretion protein